MGRLSLKIAGASGQGINTVGEILAKTAKRSGLFVVAYREYPSLIKGGHATYQLDFSPGNIQAASANIHIAVILNRQATNWHVPEMHSKGLIIHDIPNPRINQDEFAEIQAKKIKLLHVPALELATEAGGNEIMVNIVVTGLLCKVIGLDVEILSEVVRQTFASKPQYIEQNLACVRAGFEYVYPKAPKFTTRLLKPDEISEANKLKLHATQLPTEFALQADKPLEDTRLLLAGNEALSLGAIAAGMRVYYSYPMTPSSSILDYLAETQAETGVIVKQAEDEITAAAMAVGSMHAGTRALTGTSGGGFDLMTEHVSLAGILETPFVAILAQRPGPATGLPTWTAQADLDLALYAGHGEFTRCIIAPGNVKEAFTAIQSAFNLAEEFQIPVFVLTDKWLAETLFTVDKKELLTIPIERHLVLGEDLAKLKSTDRYKLTDSGVSPRWLPGSQAADYDANSDEHDEEGNVVEDSIPSQRMYEKRLRKLEALSAKLPAPEIFNNSESEPQIKLIGWGSTLVCVQDVLEILGQEGISASYMHLQYVWPFPKQAVIDYLQTEENKNTAILEGNATGQMQNLIMQQTGIKIANSLRRFDGRPFTPEEIVIFIKSKLLKKN